jgi:hypothetical protein
MVVLGGLVPLMGITDDARDKQLASGQGTQRKKKVQVFFEG